MKPQQSSLWNLRWFRKQFYLRFSLCRMHVSIEGNWTRHTEYICALYGPPLWPLLNKRIAAATKGYPTLKHLHDIIKKGNRKNQPNQIVISTFTAEQIECWLQVRNFLSSN